LNIFLKGNLFLLNLSSTFHCLMNFGHWESPICEFGKEIKRVGPWLLCSPPHLSPTGQFFQRQCTHCTRTTPTVRPALVVAAGPRHHCPTMLPTGSHSPSVSPLSSAVTHHRGKFSFLFSFDQSPLELLFDTTPLLCSACAEHHQHRVPHRCA
jgi:hypothetical protein